MEALRLFKQLYSLDTLDTRLTADKGPQTPKDAATTPSKWKTLEFYCYAAVLLLAVPNMFLSVMKVSDESHPNYPKFEAHLSDGWIPGRKVDNSDPQYSSFREKIPYTAFALLVHPLLRRLYNTRFPLPQNDSRSALADERLRQRTSFDFIFALALLSVLHGFSALKILLILSINFQLATRLPKPYIPAATWTFNVGILFLNEFYSGYHYASLFQAGSVLDYYGGLVSRWEILFNFTILRTISFNMDYYWSLDHSPIELDPTNLSERERVTTPSPPETYQSLQTYIAYTLYSPLYLAGPILTFNDYISQSRYPSPTISARRTFLYGIRLVVVLLVMEVMIHYIYTVAICASSPDWNSYTPFQLSMLGYFNLHLIWLKLLIPFRFFRLWALLDGTDPPENVVRCMSDNYSALAFWRGWHRSFNRWIVRYLYVPLGGADKRAGGKVRGVLNTLVVFTFVALWHDINLRLLAWGWLITLFVLPEILSGMAFPASNYKTRQTLYRVLCGIGAVGNILLMMVANLVGFGIGLDGVKGMIIAIVSSLQGLGFLGVACGTLFVAAQIMFEVREGEKRRGIRLKF